MGWIQSQAGRALFEVLNCPKSHSWPQGRLRPAQVPHFVSIRFGHSVAWVCITSIYLHPEPILIPTVKASCCFGLQHVKAGSATACTTGESCFLPSEGRACSSANVFDSAKIAGGSFLWTIRSTRCPCSCGFWATISLWVSVGLYHGKKQGAALLRNLDGSKRQISVQRTWAVMTSCEIWIFLIFMGQVLILPLEARGYGTRGRGMPCAVRAAVLQHPRRWAQAQPGLRIHPGSGLDLEIPSRDPNLPPGFISSLLFWGGTCSYFQPPKAGCLDMNWWEKASFSRAVMPVAILLPLASFPVLISTSVAFLYHQSPAQWPTGNASMCNMFM